MPISYEVDARARLVRAHWTARVTLQDVVAHLRALKADPDVPRRVLLLWDVTGVDELALDGEEIRIAVMAVSLTRVERIALVAGNKLVYGVARVAQAHAEGVGLDIMPFTDRDMAEAWLRES